MPKQQKIKHSEKRDLLGCPAKKLYRAETQLRRNYEKIKTKLSIEQSKKIQLPCCYWAGCSISGRPQT